MGYCQCWWPLLLDGTFTDDECWYLWHGPCDDDEESA